jgi:plastocyanin
MANIKISQLPLLTNPVDATKIPVVDSGSTKTVTASLLASYVHTKIPAASTSTLGAVKIDGVTVTINGSGQLVSVFTGGTVSAATTFSSTLNITGSVVSPATAVGNVIAFNYDNQAAFPTASTYHGAILHSHADGRMYMSHNGWQPMALLSDVTSYSLPTATTTVLGGVKVDGSTITINGSGVISSTGGSSYTLPTASTSVLGGVKVDGSTITINGSGVISSTGGSVYTLPTATTSVLGGVKVDGSTITINGSGVISSASAYSLPTASTSVLGGVRIDGSTITLNGSSQLVANYTTYSLPSATTSALGGVIIPVVGTSGINNTSGTIGLATASTSQLGGVKVDGSTITINGSGVIAATGAGAVVYKGTWNASTNTPTLANGVGTAGWQYAVSVSGTTNFGAGAITFTVGDFVLYSGTVWQQIAAGGVSAAGTLTGTTLSSNVVTSSLTTVGTLANLTVTNTITGSVSGNAGTVTSITGNTLTSGQVTTALGFTPGTAYALPTASTTVLGGVKIDGTSVTINGSGVISASTSYSLPTATTSVLGGVKIDGSTITISGSGVINANYTTYSLPTASSSVLGGVKVGTGLTIDGAGILGASGPTYAAITTLVVTTPVFNYNIDQYSGDNPAIYAISGTTIAFNLQVGSSHPFLIQNNTGSWANITTANLIHVSTSGVVSTGSSAQGQVSGTLYWKIPISVSGTFRYICQNHSTMVGVITITPKDNIGYLNIPQNSQSAAYTLTLADAGKHIFHPSTDANTRTYTIPANSSVAYPIGTALAFINMTSQVVTIAIDTDTMYLSGTGTTGSRSLAQYGSASAIKITATSWLISGSGLT